MAKYRKKPVVIEAFQYMGDLKGDNLDIPKWAEDALDEGVLFYGSEQGDEPACELYINTFEGVHHASVGDYIIQGVKGELYPCKPDIFKRTYEPAD